MIFDLDISKKEGQNKIQSYSSQGLFLERDKKIQKKSLTFQKPSKDLIFHEIGLNKGKLNFQSFYDETFKLDFTPISSCENVPGNYDNYLNITLSHIAKMRNIKFNYELESPLLYEDYPIQKIKEISSGDKKVLLLDLDETLIHADFKGIFLKDKNIKYDTMISFYSEEEEEEEEDDAKTKDDDSDSNMTDDENKDYSKKKILFKVGIFLRPGVKEFLDEASKYFEIGIFTASVKEYADAVINYLDPENKYIKFRLYRNNCVIIGDSLTIKDLRILKNIKLKNVILVDNNIYSFASQLKNGILINSFINDKKDSELSSVLFYLINYIFPADDVREVNEQFFQFVEIVNSIIENSI